MTFLAGNGHTWAKFMGYMELYWANVRSMTPTHFIEDFFNGFDCVMHLYLDPQDVDRDGCVHSSGSIIYLGETA